MKRIAWLLVLAAGCAPKRVPVDVPAPEVGAYYPLAVGNKWVYEVTRLGVKSTETVEILKIEDGFYRDSTGAKLEVDAYGVRDDKRYLLRGPLEVGRSWTNVVSIQGVERYKIIEFGQSCEVPAGRYEVCVRVEGRIKADQKTELVNEMTFAAGAGLVRIKVVAETGGKVIPQHELQLRELHLAAKAK